MKIYEFGDKNKPSIMLFPAPAAIGKPTLDTFLMGFRSTFILWLSATVDLTIRRILHLFQSLTKF